MWRGSFAAPLFYKIFILRFVPISLEKVSFLQMIA